MSLSRFSKSLVSITSTFGLVTISNLVFIDAVGAFSINLNSGITNGGFESSIAGSQNGWSTTGDVTTKGVFDGINPTNGSNQAIITNSYQTAGDRNDNNNFSFNQSTTNPVDADTIPTNHTGQDLQTFLGLGTNALSIPRSDGLTATPRTSKEGSGMYQDFTINVSSQDVTNNKNGFTVSFNAAYLTNDGKSPALGNQDFAFSSLYKRLPTPVENGAIDLLHDSNGTISPATANNDFNNTKSYQTFTKSVTGLTAGNYTYRAAFGVVDTDSYDRSSALMLDNFAVQQVPFDFSPTAGLGLVASIFGLTRLRRKFQRETD